MTVTPIEDLLPYEDTADVCLAEILKSTASLMETFVDDDEVHWRFHERLEQVQAAMETLATEIVEHFCREKADAVATAHPERITELERWICRAVERGMRNCGVMPPDNSFGAVPISFTIDPASIAKSSELDGK